MTLIWRYFLILEPIYTIFLQTTKNFYPSFKKLNLERLELLHQSTRWSKISNS